MPATHPHHRRSPPSFPRSAPLLPLIRLPRRKIPSQFVPPFLLILIVLYVLLRSSLSSPELQQIPSELTKNSPKLPKTSPDLSKSSPHLPNASSSLTDTNSSGYNSLTSVSVPTPLKSSPSLSFDSYGSSSPFISLILLSSADLTSLRQTLDDIRSQTSLPISLFHPSSVSSSLSSVLPANASITLIPFSSSRPYQSFLQPISSSPILSILAGTRLSTHALSWFSAAIEHFISSPNIAAIFLDPAVVRTKEDSEWKPIQQSDTGVSIYQLAVGGAAYWIREDVASSFAEWLHARRGEWYRFPEFMDNTPLGMGERPERNWTRGAWNVWFSRYMTEYNLFAVYKKGDALAYHDRLDFARDMNISSKLWKDGANAFWNGENEKFKADGTLIKPTKFKGVERIVELGRNQGGVVSFTMVNDVFLDTAQSWLCNVDIGGFRPKGLVWAVTDKKAKDVLDTVPGTATVLLDEVQGGKETGHEFGNPGYWKLMLERTQLIGEILNSGVAVFAFETDAIWLEDPAPYIEELVLQDADIVGTINSKTEVSGNFFFLRPTLATRRLWDEIVHRFEDAFTAAKFERKRANSWTYIDNDQSLLTTLVLNNDTWKKSYPLSFLTLDMEKFVDGRWYKPEDGFYTTLRARKPVVINNNFVIGVEAKMERAKKWGHWFWDEKLKKCLDGTVNKAVRKSVEDRLSMSYSDGHDGAFSPRRGGA